MGSTIGNYEDCEAASFLNEIRGLLKPGDWLLLGIDRLKEKTTLELAYDDAQGVTARFNLNVLTILNRELGANFAIENYSHCAVFNEEKSRIEMHIVSQRDQKVTFPALNNHCIEMKCGETICTEISRKLTPQKAKDLLERCAYQIKHHFTPANEYFSLFLSLRRVLG